MQRTNLCLDASVEAFCRKADNAFLLCYNNYSLEPKEEPNALRFSKQALRALELNT